MKPFTLSEVIFKGHSSL